MFIQSFNSLQACSTAASMPPSSAVFVGLFACFVFIIFQGNRILCLCWRRRHAVVTEDALFFLSFSFSISPLNFALATFSWKQARSTWNFNIMYRTALVRGRAFCFGNLTKIKNYVRFSIIAQHPQQGSWPVGPAAASWLSDRGDSNTLQRDSLHSGVASTAADLGTVTPVQKWQSQSVSQSLSFVIAVVLFWHNSA